MASLASSNTSVEQQDDFKMEENVTPLELEAIFVTSHVPDRAAAPRSGGEERGGLAGSLKYTLISNDKKRLHCNKCNCDPKIAHMAKIELNLVLNVEQTSDSDDNLLKTTIKVDVVGGDRSYFFLDGFSGKEEHDGGALFRRDWYVTIGAKPQGTQNIKVFNQKPTFNDVRVETITRAAAVDCILGIAPAVQMHWEKTWTETFSQLQKNYNCNPLKERAEWCNSLRVRGGEVLNTNDIKNNWWSLKTLELDSPYVKQALLPESVTLEFSEPPKKPAEYNIVVTLGQKYWNVVRKRGPVFSLKEHQWEREFTLTLPKGQRPLNALFQKHLKEGPTVVNLDPPFPNPSVVPGDRFGVSAPINSLL